MRPTQALLPVALLCALTFAVAPPAASVAALPTAHAAAFGDDDPADDGFDDPNWDGDDNPDTDDLPVDPGDGSDPVPEIPQAPELPSEPTIPLVTKPTVGGTHARLRTNGKAAIPRGAPKRVREIIAAANKIIGKPYKWGGGHAKLFDRGYDCSGAVSFALIVSGNLQSPLVSGGFARWGGKGRARWVTIYANKKHVYMEVAGLRFDTSDVGDPVGKAGVRWRPGIGQRRGFKVRHLPHR